MIRTLYQTRTVAFAFAVLLVLVWAIGLRPDGAFDDAYITYRYADNLRAGHGLVYNPGEWVLGTTAPLFALLLGVVGVVVADLEWLGHVIGVGGWMAAAAGAVALLWDEQRPWVGWVAGLLVVLQPLLMLSIGMETAWVVALMLWSAWAWLNGHKRRAALLLAAMLLTRQDTALWALVVGLEVWRRERRLPWRETLATIALTLPWFTFALWRYGSILPNSVVAKAGQQASLPTGAPLFVRALGDSMLGQPVTWQGILFGVGFAVGVVAIGWRFRHFWWLLAWLLLFTLVYHILGVETFAWYFVPPLTVAQLVAALGFGFLAAPAASHKTDPAAVARGRLGLVFLLAGLLVVGRSAAMAQAQATRSGHRVDYRAVGAWLAQNTPPTATVATIEIGVIGFLSERLILDTMGLVSPEMTSHLFGWSEVLVYAVAGHQPDFVVVVPDTAWDYLLETWWFRATYQPVAQLGSVSIHQRVMPLTTRSPSEVRYESGLSVDELHLSSHNVTPGEQIEAFLRVTVEEAPHTSLLVTAFLVDPQSYERVALVTEPPFSGLYSSLYWQPGDRLLLPVRLTVPPDLAAGAYQFGWFLYDAEAQREVPLQGTEATVAYGDWIRVGQLPPPTLATRTVRRPVRVAWQEGILLEALTLPADPLPAGASLPVTLSWLSSATPTRNLTVFVHLLNEAGEMVTQVDQRPFRGRVPTPAWEAGEALTETVELALPLTLPPGSYDLRLGLYDEAGRLPLSQESGDFFVLPDEVEITAP